MKVSGLSIHYRERIDKHDKFIVKLPLAIRMYLYLLRKSTIQQLSNFTFPKGRVPRQAGPNTQFVIQWEVEEFERDMQCSQLSFWLIRSLLHVCQKLSLLFSLV